MGWYIARRVNQTDKVSHRKRERERGREGDIEREKEREREKEIMSRILKVLTLAIIFSLQRPGDQEHAHAEEVPSRHEVGLRLRGPESQRPQQRCSGIHPEKVLEPE